VLAENSSTESCQIQTFTPRANDVAVIDSTFVADSIFDGGPNHGLFFVDSALFAMEHGSYFNPSIRPDTTGSPVTSADNLKDCKAGQNVDSLSLNLHEFNLQCTKPPEQNEFLAWWAAVENHEGYGTPGHGPADNGHQAQREVAAALPENDPYAIVEPLVAASRQDLRSRLGNLVWEADVRIADASGNHGIVRENWGTWDPVKGSSCGNIYVYWIDAPPAEYARTYVCEAKDE